MWTAGAAILKNAANLLRFWPRVGPIWIWHSESQGYGHGLDTRAFRHNVFYPRKWRPIAWGAVAIFVCAVKPVCDIQSEECTIRWARVRWIAQQNQFRAPLGSPEWCLGKHITIFDPTPNKKSITFSDMSEKSCFHFNVRRYSIKGRSYHLPANFICEPLNIWKGKIVLAFPPRGRFVR